MRTIPLIGVLLFVAVALVWRPWFQYRRYGSAGIALFRARGHGAIARDALAILWLALLVGQAVAVAAWSDWLARRALVAIPEAVTMAGTIVLAAGIVLLVTAQLMLGRSWRIGIEEDARPGLVTAGLYRYSRNPIFLGMLVVLVGYVLLIPTLLSLALLVGTYFGIRRQVAAEERYLARAYGEAYRDYARRVGRFVPGIGRGK
jgi:protein-S-isoprenylcysteine O-methyltransferase Ste14